MDRFRDYLEREIRESQMDKKVIKEEILTKVIKKYDKIKREEKLANTQNSENLGN